MGDTPSPTTFDCAILGASTFLFTYNGLGGLTGIESWLGLWAVQPWSAFLGGTIGSMLNDVISKSTYHASIQGSAAVGAYAALAALVTELVLRALGYESRIATAIGASLGAFYSTCALPKISLHKKS